MTFEFADQKPKGSDDRENVRLRYCKSKPSGEDQKHGSVGRF